VQVGGPAGGRSLRALLGVAAEAALPQRCLACGRFGAALHPACVAALPRAEGPRCGICWEPGAASPCARCAAGADALAVDALRAAFPFEGVARRAILEAKFRGVSTLLAPLGHAAAAAVPPAWAPDVIVPVPLAVRRHRARGFNQAEIAARPVAERIGAPIATGLVRRVRETTAQSTLDARGRRHNLDGAFAVRGGVPPRVLVVDDVATTGATLSAVARALRTAGAEQVYGLALARED
jgi:ComF family protein